MFGKNVRIGLNLKLEPLILASYGFGCRGSGALERGGDHGERCLELSPGKNLLSTLGQQHTAFWW